MNETKLKEEIAFGLFNGNFGVLGSLWGNNNGNIYIPTAGGAGAAGGFWAYWFWLQTWWFSRYQRYASRYMYLSNGYAATLVNNQTILVLGNGFQYQTDDEQKQKKLDKWLKKTKWRMRSIESFRRFLTDGECFIRKFDNDVLRFVDPDYIYSSTSDRDQTLGIITDSDDYETIESYSVHKGWNEDFEGERVPADEIQHRKNGHFGARRGLSWLLPILSDLATADRLTNSLGRTAEVLAKIALIRKHKASQAGVQQFRDNIQTQLPQVPLGQNGTPPGPVPADNIENYADGSILDMSDSVDPTQLGGLTAEGFMAVLDATLRKCSAHCHLPAGVFNLRDSNESYNSELVSNSYIVRSIEALQEEWKEYDLELLEMCGFDTEDISIIAPEVSIIDVESLIKQMDFLMQNQMVSKATVSKSFGLNPEAEANMQKMENQSIDTGDVNSRRDRADGMGSVQQDDASLSQDMRVV